MINILPKEGRGIARKEYLLRVFTISVLAAALVGIICSALLFPSYLIANSTKQEAIAETARLDAAKQKRGETTSAPLTLAKEELALFSPLASTTLPSDVIAKLLQNRSSGISIVSLLYDLGSGKITLSGIAGTRDTLLAFFEAIKTTPGVMSADLPVNDLAKSENAPFSISITYASP